VLAVGAVDRNLQIAEFSGAPTPKARRDIYGIGVDVMSSIERDRQGKSYYLPLNGTSMAAPYVAGVAALLRSTNPGASASDVRDHLLSTAIEGERGLPVARFHHWR
jgi:subtilisin family serine protease